jgi:hypothetical protein
MGGKGRPARGAGNLTAICDAIVLKMWEPRRLTTLWAFMACYRNSFTFSYFKFNILSNVRNRHGLQSYRKVYIMKNILVINSNYPRKTLSVISK